jgi:hypothetical protein|tara:strand:+ start:3417 stop:3620 length:204 start_codon:yes stop_codon:yes gene_type:complete
MTKYLLIADYGYGPEEEIIETDSYVEAQEQAYELWREGAESVASYEALELTQEVAENYGYEHELESE